VHYDHATSRVVAADSTSVIAEDSNNRIIDLLLNIHGDIKNIKVEMAEMKVEMNSKFTAMKVEMNSKFTAMKVEMMNGQQELKEHTSQSIMKLLHLLHDESSEKVGALMVS
jgi:hypothetical protein